MLLIKWLIALAIIILSNRLRAQQPAYFVFGEEQFRGIQIYDVIQDKDFNYLFGTNEGLFYFDSYTYEKIECTEAKSSSVFNFVINQQGEIFCHNLNNQIFQLIGKELKVFYELQSDESSPDISLSIGDDGNLVVAGKKIIIIDRKAKKINQFDLGNNFVGQPFVSSTKIIQFHQYHTNTIVSYSNGVFSTNNFQSGSKIDKDCLLCFYKTGTKNYALDKRTKNLYEYDDKAFKLTSLPNNAIFERSGSVRIYEMGENTFVAGSLQGVGLINDKKKSTSLIYENYYISDVFKDHEGNILLSTFDKGILVIPNLEIQDVIQSFKEDPATSLFADSLNGLFIGTTKGNLLNYNNTVFTVINNIGKRPIDAIYGDNHNDLIIYDDGYIRAYNKKTKKHINITEASLKDAVIISEKEFFIGTNRGILKINLEGPTKFTLEVIKGLQSRIYSIEYNFEDSCLYAATSNGFYVLFFNGKTQKIIYNNEDVFPNSLCYDKSSVYAITKKHGIFVLKNGKIIKTIKPLLDGKIEFLKKSVIFNNTIISKSQKGLIQFDMDGNLLSSLHSVFGIISKRIIDFTISRNKLWVSHTNGVQFFDMNSANAKTLTPLIKFNTILLNDKSIDIHKTGNFNSGQRKINFVFSSPSLKNRETIRYYYKLIGNDTAWSINKYESNQVSYNALAPGNYTFTVKAENQGVYSKPISFVFSIAHPFYELWWFITLVIVFFLGIVFLIYRWQLNIQRKKSQQINELNASKLTAIQSQMNPHFIFNSLNSIQDLILKGDVEHSYSYITTFSNLVRRTLSYSEKDFIDFDQELKLLELYLSLEKLRFKKDLDFEININNVEDIMLPPLLIQPFIENSLLHGLLHKEGRKVLKITFELKDTLICTVEDNGIGREKAKAIKLRQRSEHESFSGKAIHKRFEILSNVFEGNFGYKYEDLYENNESTGTKVILSIPIKHKF